MKKIMNVDFWYVKNYIFINVIINDCDTAHDLLKVVLLSRSVFYLFIF